MHQKIQKIYQKLHSDFLHCTWHGIYCLGQVLITLIESQGAQHCWISWFHMLKVVAKFISSVYRDGKSLKFHHRTPQGSFVCSRCCSPLRRLQMPTPTRSAIMRVHLIRMHRPYLGASLVSSVNYCFQHVSHYCIECSRDINERLSGLSGGSRRG